MLRPVLSKLLHLLLCVAELLIMLLLFLDEAQNATESQLKMFLTRMGPSAKFIVTGDVTQIDLPRNQPSGLVQAIKILSNVKGIDFIYLDAGDVVRHRLVKEIIEAYNR